NLAPAVASAQEAAHGKFTLTHEVHWQNAVIPAGEYRFWLDTSGNRVLWLNRVSSPRTSFVVVAPAAEEIRAAGENRIVLESTPAGSYVSALQLPEFGMALRFPVPPSATDKQMAKAGTTAMGSAQ